MCWRISAVSHLPSRRWRVAWAIWVYPHSRRSEQDILSAWRRHCKELVWSMRPQTPSPPLWCQRIFVCVSQLLPGPTESKRWVHTNTPPHFGLGSAWTKVPIKVPRKQTVQPSSCCHGCARMHWLKRNRKSESLGRESFLSFQMNVACHSPLLGLFTRGVLWSHLSQRQVTKVQGVQTTP